MDQRIILPSAFTRTTVIQTNWGVGYDEYEVTVDHLSNGGSFATGNEDVVITFTGGDIYALVTPSDGHLD